MHIGVTNGDNIMTYTQDQIKKILAQHLLWLGGKEMGCRANLVNANLRGVNLRGAILVGANLVGANLVNANLVNANLRGAILVNANLRGAILVNADLEGVNLVGADLRGAILEGASLLAISNIHARVFEAASQEGALDMKGWHCGTSHCRAGWVTTLSGDAGKMLEAMIGTGPAAALIYAASDPFLECVPDFYCNNETALADMKRLASIEAANTRPTQTEA
jgi:uncharacterized protein YjbI with pentapeptide repeats